jgi:hypothetical protein
VSDSTPKPAPAPAKAARPEWPKTVRTTIQPEVDLEVGEAEYTDLSRQGLLVTEKD